MFILGWDYYAKQIVYLEQALELYRRNGEAERATRIHIEMASAYSANNASTMDTQRCMRHFQAAEVLLAESSDHKLRSRVARKLANAHVWSGHTAEGPASRRAVSLDAS